MHIGVVEDLQRGSVIIFRVNLRRRCREVWLGEQRAGEGKKRDVAEGPHALEKRKES